MTYALHDAATVTGLPAATVASWLDRGVIETTKPGKGGRREFSIRDLDRLAVIGELCRLGLPTAKAAQGAAAFSDQRSFKRPKGQLNRDGLQTYLVVRDGDATIYGVTDAKEFADTVRQIFSDSAGAIVVDVSEVLRRVDLAIAGKGAVQLMPPAAKIFRDGREEFYP
ncbi:MAG: MerR family transcriptional regulator [Methylovirgula sp.]